MAIRFACPHCGKWYKMVDEVAGRTVRCSSCARDMKVPLPVARPDVSPAQTWVLPTATRPKSDEEDAESSTDESDLTADVAKGRPLWKDPIIEIGAAVHSLILIVFFGYLAWRHLQASPNRDAIITWFVVIQLASV
jgi:predicted Zn finger-like uncharacterized protein